MISDLIDPDPDVRLDKHSIRSADRRTLLWQWDVWTLVDGLGESMSGAYMDFFFLVHSPDVGECRKEVSPDSSTLAAGKDG